MMYLEYARKLPFTGGELVYVSTNIFRCFVVQHG